jgi:DnaJ-class molecular chaperone
MFITFKQIANPEKYGLEECPHCNGYGSSLKEKAVRCTKCKGSGLMKKEDALKYKETNK